MNEVEEVVKEEDVVGRDEAWSQIKLSSRLKQAQCTIQ